MKTVKIRYNTLVNDDLHYWRVIIDGEEHLASDVIINVPTYTTKDIVFDKFRGEEVTKHHITCDVNEITWVGSIVNLK